MVYFITRKNDENLVLSALWMLFSNITAKFYTTNWDEGFRKKIPTQAFISKIYLIMIWKLAYR